MILSLGEFSLWIALPISVWGSVLGVLGERWEREDLRLSARRSIHAVFVFLVVASAAIVVAFVTDRFEYALVVDHSSRNLDLAFKVSGLWAGPAGSFLFWALNLGFVSTVAVESNRGRAGGRDPVPFAPAILLGALAILLVLLLFVSSPFERLPAIADYGRGLAPELQSYWTLIRRPLVQLGLAGFAVPFALAGGALYAGRPDARWLELTRGWMLACWLVLTLGLLAGLRQSFGEAGGEAGWYRAPIENGSFLPWLAALAFLLSSRFQAGREFGRTWTVALVSTTFLLAIFAGVLSVYPPATGGGGEPWPSDGALNRVAVPMGLLLLLLVGIAPAIGIRRGTAAALNRGIHFRVLTGVGAGAWFWVLGARQSLFLITVSLAAFALASVAVECCTAMRASAGREGEPGIRPRSHSSRRPALLRLSRRCGPPLAHLGAVAIIVGFAGSALRVEVMETMEPGDSVAVSSFFGQPYTLTYEGLSSMQGRSMWQMIATFSVRRGDHDLGLVMTERRLHQAPPLPVTRPGTHSSPGEKLQVILTELDEGVGLGNDPQFHRARFRFLMNPLVSLIWYGGLALASGMLIAFWPRVGVAGNPEPAAPPSSDSAGAGAEAG